MAECGTNMCGTNICVCEWDIIQPSFPYNTVMDSSWQCKICDRGEGEKGTRSGLGFGCNLSVTFHEYPQQITGHSEPRQDTP